MIQKQKIIIDDLEKPLSLELITIGSGNPRTFIISGIHGNEHTGNVIINKMLESLPEFTGTLTILPIANPTGYQNNVRVEPETNTDLNRHFQSDHVTDVAGKLISAIKTIAKNQDFIFDLHNFKTAGLIQVVSNHVGTSDEVAASFNPDLVRGASKEQASKNTGTFNKFAKEINIPYVLFELPIETKITNEQVNNIVTSLIEFITSKGKVRDGNTSFNLVPKVAIRTIKAPQDGEFIVENEVGLRSRVVEGQTIGKLTSNGETIPIQSVCSGIICEIDVDQRRTVKMGNTLVGIGEYIV